MPSHAAPRHQTSRSAHIFETIEMSNKTHQAELVGSAGDNEKCSSEVASGEQQ